jgi:hypothetical protein
MAFVEQFESDDAKDFLRQLVNGDHLEGAALGITKLLIDKGPGALSGPQAYVFQQSVSQYWTESCKRCAGNIPWAEQYDAYDNGGLCSWCWHMTTKDD